MCTVPKISLYFASQHIGSALVLRYAPPVKCCYGKLSHIVSHLRQYLHGAYRTPGDCVVTAWKDVGDCSVTCGSGVQRRERVIKQQSGGAGAGCPELTETVSCNMNPCPGTVVRKSF